MDCPVAEAPRPRFEFKFGKWLALSPGFNFRLPTVRLMLLDLNFAHFQS